MKDGRASVTARFVAVCRGLAPLLPEDARVVDDPYGARVLGDGVARVIDALSRAPGPLRAVAWAPLLPALPWAVYMQVRTRALDDALRAFYAAGGRQVVILGAGFDARAARLRDALPGVTFFEVDHPATQSLKRARLGPFEGARALPWDFERDPLRELPARLAGLGHDPAAPTFTLWEGVTMYLSRSAFDATLDAVADYSAPGSRIGFNYVEADALHRPGVAASLAAAVVRVAGEPFRLGLSPASVRDALAARGFTVMWDETFLALARRLLPGRWSRLVRAGRRLAVVERTAAAQRM